MLIKRDCTAGRKRERSKQGFISLVFQAAVFSLSTAGSRRGRERESRQEERLLMRCGGGSINWGRYGPCYSSACYPEVGRLPDLEALTYLRDSVSHRAPLLQQTPQCFTVPLQSQPNQRAAGGYQMVHMLHQDYWDLSQASLQFTCRPQKCILPARGLLKAMSYKYVCSIS